MRTKIPTALGLILFLSAGSLADASNNFASPKEKRPVVVKAPAGTLSVGERFDYEVSWLGVPIGLAWLEIKEKAIHHGREAFHVVAGAKTNDVLFKLYPVEDEIHSWIDAKDFVSLEFRKTLREGRYRADERVIYDASARKGFYESLKNGSKKDFPLENPARDLLCVFYWFRLQNISPGQTVKTMVHGDEKEWDLELRVMDTQVQEMRGGIVIPTIRVEPRTRLKGVLYQRGRAWVYYSTDSRRIPVLLVVQTPFGPVTGALTQ